VKTAVSVAAVTALLVLVVGGALLVRGSDVGGAEAAPPAATGLVPPAPASSSPPVDVSDWLNSEPIGPEDLRGKVVLYDFWTFACINCQHTLPYVKAWHERYAADGLVVLSVHSPELDFEADRANVVAFVAEHDIDYPVALDPHRSVWRAFGNHYWPTFYVDDRTGARRYQHFGEGRYDETEDVLRLLLGVDPTSPRADVDLS
jgi:thiol-disulfide isomerase/thioredoxin